MGVRVSFINRPIERQEIGFPVSSRQTAVILELFELVRETEEGVRIRAIELSATDMAQGEVQALIEQLAREFGLTDVEFWQRLGVVPAGEAMRLLRIGGPDQQQAVEALSTMADRLSHSRSVRRQLQRG